MKIFWIVIVIVIVNGLHFKTKHDNDDLAPMLNSIWSIDGINLGKESI